jgi:hypothetical protein
MKKILICGDSFAADWTIKYPGEGWPNLLAKEYDVTNLAQAGCSEYRIHKQLSSVDLNLFDYILVFHTSPNRLYTSLHPVHSKDPLHSNSDLIYTDVKEHSKTNTELVPIVEYFEKHFDMEYAVFMHNLLCKQIEKNLEPYNVIHASGIDYEGLYQFSDMMQFNSTVLKNRGTINHCNDTGNKIIYESIINRLKHR